MTVVVKTRQQEPPRAKRGSGNAGRIGRSAGDNKRIAVGFGIALCLVVLFSPQVVMNAPLIRPLWFDVNRKR
ncbi:hypothetical protein D3273_26795 [Lichenibacterium minor]|uniref:Uncharacterized protein n=1 Tax=Lichenibacterium minor TaxID=2316528 RepID=A0A4Q2TZW5_9HYPH|nr:hypothetical protein [Lichenibacterium minor]RYC28898.1 hypothetical protein D3273_26795 [Lichenibacterium minor]